MDEPVANLLARQMYGLGKLVKKFTRGVKKIVKSPIGKAALGYVLTGGLGNLAQGTNFFANFASPKTFIGGGLSAIKGKLFGLHLMLVVFQELKVYWVT